MPWSSIAAAEEDLGPTLDPSLFRDADDQYPGGWWSFPQEWRSSESSVLADEVRAQVQHAIDALPERQRVVVTLRDVMGHSSDEVCQMLEISGANQRVLLHRARAAVRSHLVPYLADASSATDEAG